MPQVQLSKGEKRREAIVQHLKVEGRITIQQIVQHFQCSEATARRDLEQLSKQERIIRTIGGARYEGIAVAHELPFSQKEHLAYLEKERVAELAVSLINEGDIVGLSGGTTSFLLAKLLKERQGITVVTNAINIAMELAGSSVQVVVIGGILRHNSFELCGPLGEAMISQLHIGKMFVGVDGISLSGGISSYSEQEAQTVKALMSRSEMTIALFDHTKWNKTSLFSVAPLSELDIVVTDRRMKGDLEKSLTAHQVKIYAVVG
ncbi:DeoR/GlpR family DNA-binding transcription regulator [Paenibacillus yanchengensis]|uniref:DeoR/GlpR family DNA-binding transcription regulator n=1 Tax=Paenibacillus yanchengensis TaxID=2035833 RepID=A0ABW4YLX5_9BACL